MKKYLFLITLLLSFVSKAQFNNKTVSDGSTGGGVPTTATGSSTEVGVTSGGLSVSLSGAAIYNIPIAVPPGINGIEPQLSLNYSSQSAVGIAGYGWNLGGLSSITRVPSTKYHDGVIGSVNFSTSDKFALDGQRLMLKSGTYGIAGSLYETENFSNLKISLLANGSNLYFLVEYPDGSTAYYGSTADSKVGELVYGLSYWQNPQNVRITYTYLQTNNFAYVTSIKYGARNSDTPINEIQFVYKNRLQNEVSYIKGISIVNDKVLSQIIVKGNSVGYRNYVLNHDTTTGYERLINIVEKNGDNTKSYNPTVFNYMESSSIESIISAPSTTFTNGSISSEYVSPINGDFDGNGDLDVILPNLPNFTIHTGINDNTASSSGYTYTMNLPINYTPFQVFPLKALTGDGTIGYKILNKDNWGVSSIVRNTDNSVYSIFYNIYSYQSTTNPVNLEYTKEFILPTGTFDGYVGYKQLFGDFNGDGISDIIAVPFQNTNTPDDIPHKIFFINLDKRISSNYVKLLGETTELCSNKKIIKTGDFNGDGKTDIIAFAGAPINKIYVYSLDNNENLVKLFETSYSFSPRKVIQNYSELPYIFETLTANLPNINLETDITIGDYNGDGKTDFLLPAPFTETPEGNPTKGDTVLFYSTGTDFVTEILPFFPYLFSNYVSTDFDNDGKTDLIGYFTGTSTNNSPIQLHYIKKQNNTWIDNIQSFSSPLRNQISKNRPAIITTSKVNDSKMELAVLSKESSGQVKLYYFVNNNDKTNQRLLSSIKLGNGVEENISYSTLVDNNGVYTKSQPQENYPNYDINYALGFKVVSQLERKSSSVYKKQLYKYYGATSNIEGQGFLGFRSVLTTNWFSDTSQIISNITNYNVALRGAPSKSFSVLGLVSPTLTLGPLDPYLNKISYDYNYNIFSDSYDNPLLPNKVFKIRNTLVQKIDGLTDVREETSTLYDVYNNPKEISTTTYADNSNESQIVSQSLTYDNLPLSTPYFIGRLKNKIHSKSIYPSNESSVNEEYYSYDANLIKQVKKRAINSGQVTDYIIESNDYDIYGNIIKKTMSSTGLVDRISNFEYDVTTHRFLIKKVDILGLETSYTYDMSKGLVLSEILPSITGYPIKTVFNYDSWGKRISAINYLGATATKSETITYVNNTSGGITKTLLGNEGSNSKIILDELGRKNHEGVRNLNGKWSYISTYYDINDKPIIVSQPYFESLDGLGTFSVWNEMQYDVYGRLIQSNSLKSDYSDGKLTTYLYDWLKTTENDGQKTKETQKNPMGEIVSVTDTPIGGLATTINYSYFANGNLKNTLTNGTNITIAQDGWGRKKTLTDPSAGTYNYTYNNFGEIKVEEVIGKGTTTYNLDDYGRVTSKVISGTVNDNITTASTNTSTTYTYDATTKLLSSKLFTDSTNSYSISYAYGYDNYKRINLTSETRTGSYLFQKEYTYDAYERKDKERFYAKDLTTNKVSDKWIKYNYQNGYQWQIYDMTSSTTVGTTKLWQASTINSQGKILTATLGNGIAITNTYDDYGFPTQIKHDKGTTNIMTLGTTFEPLYGNLTNRTANLFGAGTWNETLSYDNSDRLISYKDSPATTSNQQYNANGTIATNNVGDYAYTLSGKPYSLTSITPVDQSPSSTILNYYTNRKQNIGYNLFKSPVWIIEEGKENIDFEYNDENKRSVMYYGDTQASKNSRILRKFYSVDGTIEVKRKTVGGVNTNEFITYIGGDGYAAPVILKYDGTTYSYNYLHRDYQGSIVAITNSAGAVVEKRWFDVWGAMVKYAYGAINTVPTTSTVMFLDRGYTGHEHLMGVGIINMNGRVYDPKLHRFLQPDNNIQDPLNSQNYNRYGYCLNNPTKYTDESGEYWGLEYLFGALFNSYASGVIASNGQLNPFKWDSSAWTNAGLGALSFTATNYANQNLMNPKQSAVGNNAYMNASGGSGGSGGAGGSGGGKVRYIKNGGQDNSNSYNNSSLEGASVLTGVLLADDPTGYGVIDDVIIPVAWGIAGGMWITENWKPITISVKDGINTITELADPNSGAFKYVTYTKTNAEGMVYVGRTSGYGTPEQIVRQRDKEHHMGKDTYGPYNLNDFGRAKVSVWAASTTIGYGERLNDPSYWAIRGAEQLQINNHILLGNSANIRAGIYEFNKQIDKYLEWGMKLLGF